MKNINHLIRAGILALLAIIGFTVVRFLTLPESWGKYGHYRANAVNEEMARKPVYQGADTCKGCHIQKGKRGIYPGYKDWSSGKHGVVNCENCHGPGNEHVIKHGTTTITINTSPEICLRCHLQLPARPSTSSPFPQPQIELEKHMKGKSNITCIKCHNPHHPDLKPKEAPATSEPAGKETVTNEVKPAGKEVAVSKIGRQVYEDKCVVCHGAKGDGKTETSEFLDPKPPNFPSSSYKSTQSQIIDFTYKGKGQQMPAYKDELSEEEIKEVAKYIQEFKR